MFFYVILFYNKSKVMEDNMQLFNTKSNQLELFRPVIENKVSMYVCGPTVYNHAHIGNARPIVVFDVLRRWLEASGYEVTYVSNFTDVDDKIITKAIEERVNESVIASRYISAYQDVRIKLNSKELSAMPMVTETMDAIIAFIKELEDHKIAYQRNGNVYFSVDKVSDYGSLSHQNLDALRVGARIEENLDKENPLDFVLWKKTTEGIVWNSPWGEGRPGWHTECVVMIDEAFGGQVIDIHGGGQDLKFPHHENECAQCKGLYHRELANYWMHNAMLNIDGEKMSKSLGNVWWAKDVIEKLGANVTRWILIAPHYRMSANISDDVVLQAQTEIQKIDTALRQAYVTLSLNEKEIDGSSYNQALYQEFKDAMDDDLNTPNATSALLEGIKKLNQSLRQREVDYQLVSEYVVTIEKINDILGLVFNRIILDEEDRVVFAHWQQAKAEKNYERADLYRKQLSEKGYL